MSLVEVDAVHKSFGTVSVLRGISLRVETGERIAIIGRSGSGKSTLLRCVNGLETIDQGSILFDGVGVVPNSKMIRSVRERIGFVFQDFNLFPHLSAVHNVALGLRVVKKLPRDEAISRAIDALNGVGLGDKVNARPIELSGGQQQRVAIARALAMEPKLMLFDEPTSALDPELVDEVLQTILKLATSGMTMMLVTHEMRFARRVADRLVFIDKGQILAQGPPADMFSADAPQSLRDFLRQTEHEY